MITSATHFYSFVHPKSGTIENFSMVLPFNQDTIHNDGLICAQISGLLTGAGLPLQPSDINLEYSEF